ncbi:MAG TPA: HAMP domain-containing sensor histidine kinase [Trueperaceae bacterium]
MKRSSPRGGSRGGLTRLPLRWRVAALAGITIALLAVLASLTAFWVVRRSLIGDLQESLREDVQNVAALYAQGGPGAAGASLAGPTGGVIVQLYDRQGALLAASTSEFESADAILPQPAVLIESGVRDWAGDLAGRQVRAAIAPFEFGSAVVIAETSFIARALGQLGRALFVTALALVLISALAAYLLAAAAIRPIRHLARQAARLGPERLEPIRYSGPADELGLLAGALNGLIGRLKESLDAQRQFLAETSHELRTPLTSLQGYLDRASRRASPEVARELADARRISYAMSRLIRDLLQLSRGELVQDLVPHLVDAYSDVLSPIAEEFPGVRVEGREGEAMLLGDPERLRQLIRNLTANAVRAAGSTAGVTLLLEPGAGVVELVVRDTGPGVPEEVRERIFEKFYKGQGGGTGLGLAIARQIAELHTGSIRVEGAPGRTEFRVRLPTADVPD